MLLHFGWHATLAVVVSTLVYYLWFRADLRSLTG